MITIPHHIGVIVRCQNGGYCVGQNANVCECEKEFTGSICEC